MAKSLERASPVAAASGVPSTDKTDRPYRAGTRGVASFSGADQAQCLLR
jgi:hypothetical protein